MKVMKSKISPSSGGCRADLASLSRCRIGETVPVTLPLTTHLCLNSGPASTKDRLADICKPPYLSSVDTFNWYGVVSLFL